MSFYQLYHYISGGTSLLLSSSPFQHTISLGTLKFYVGFQKFTSEPLEHCDFVDPQSSYWRSPYHTQNNLDYIKIKIVKLNSQRNRNIVVPTLFALSTHNLSQIMNQHFGHVSIYRLKSMTRKGLMEGIPKNIPDMEKPCDICILTKATNITIGLTIDVLKNPLGSCLKCIFRYSALKSSVDLPQILWLYALLLHTPLDLHP